VTDDAPVFIVGCPRSGTTLLRDLLRSHPRLAFPSESWFIPSYYRRYGDPRSDAEAIALGERILRSYWVRHWNVAVAPSTFAKDRTFAAIVSRIYEDFARQRGKARWGDKTPGYVFHLPLLTQMFPQARAIHIVRDGRDVALSWLKHASSPGNLYMAAELWIKHVRAAQTASSTLGSHGYLEIRYEDLLANSERAMRQVCLFLGEPYDERVLRPTRESRNPVSRSHRAGDDRIVTDNAFGWRRLMSGRQRRLFESVAHELLEELHYATDGAVRTVTVVEKAVWRAHYQSLRLIRAARHVNRVFA